MHENDDLVSIDEGTNLYFGKVVSKHSVRRWIASGVGVPPVRLKAVRIAGRYFLREADVAEFKEAIADPELYRRHQQTKRVEKAKARLIKAGA